MKNIILFMLLSSVIRCNAQEDSKPLVVSEVYSAPKDQKLSTDAYEVFRTNKFLNFKNKDILIEKINGNVYRKFDLNNFFGYKKDWGKIQKEDSTRYSKKKFAKYVYKDNVMIETATEYGNYEVRKEIKTIYNPKCFVLFYEKKSFVGDSYVRTESIRNEFDQRNRVVKIIKRTETDRKEDNTEYIITIGYQGEIVTITSENGTMECEFTTDENSVGTISTLGPNETAEYFRFAIRLQKFEDAKEYCNEKMIKKLESNLSYYQDIIDIKAFDGTGRYGEKVTIKEDWEVTFKNRKAEKYSATFILTKEKNGWKIDDFEISK